jgi:PAS domain S-box-containing protein
MLQSRSQQIMSKTPAVLFAVSALLSLLVVLGWHMEISLLTQFSPRLPPSRYNSALTHLFICTALLSASLGFRRLTVALSAVTFTFAALILSQYLLAVDWGIDSLLMSTEVFSHDPHPGRPSYLTCIGFMVSSAAALTFALGERWCYRAVATSLMGSVLFAIGVSALLTMLGGIGDLDIWPRFRGMPPQTAFIFVIAGIGIEIMVLNQARDAGEHRSLSRWLPVPVGVGIGTISLILCFALHHNQNTYATSLIQAEATEVTNGISSRLDSCFLLFGSLAAETARHAPGDIRRQDLSLLMSHYPGISGVHWVDRTDSGEWNFPKEGPKSYLAEERTVLASVERMGRPVLSRAFTSEEGATILIGAFPASEPSGIMGAVIAHFRADEFLGPILSSIVSPGFGVNISDDGQTIYAKEFPDSPALEAWWADSSISVFGQHWRVKVAPHAETLSSLHSYLPEATLIVGLMVALLCAILILQNERLMGEVHRRSRAEQALKVLNDQLELRVEEKTALAEKRSLDLAHSERALLEQTNVLRSVLDGMSSGVVVADTTFKMKSFNRAARAIFDHATLEALTPSGPPTGFYHSENEESVSSDEMPFARALTGETVDDLELFLKNTLHPKGIWLLASSRPILDDRGVVRSAVLVVRDITERKRAENSLRQSELKHRMVAQVTSDVIWDWDLVHDRVDWSEALCSAFGYNLDEVETSFQWWSERVHPSDSAQVLQALEEALAHSTHWQDEYRFRTGSGDYAIVENKAVLIRDENGAPVRMIGALSDITRRKRSEETDARLAAIVKNSDDAIFSLDLQGRVLTWNRGAEIIFGLNATDALQKNLLDLVTVDCRHDVEKAIESAQSGSPVQNSQVKHLKKNDDSSLLSLTLSPVRDSRGITLSLSVVARDITAIQRNQEEIRRLALDLSRSNRDLEHFAYVASHDLQEPLRMISSYMDLVKRRYGDKLGVDGHDFIEFAVEGAKRMKLLIEALLSYSRVNRRGLKLEAVDINHTLEHIKLSLREQLQHSNAEIRADELPIISADTMQMLQLFQNLIGNAIKFTRNRPAVVTINSTRKNGEWVFSVRDNGIGFDTQFSSRIFTMFQRLHSQQEYPGTGIGLAICKKIVENHGGRIWVESNVGQGSVFFVAIPIVVGPTTELDNRVPLSTENLNERLKRLKIV